MIQRHSLPTPTAPPILVSKVTKSMLNTDSVTSTLSSNTRLKPYLSSLLLLPNFSVWNLKKSFYKTLEVDLSYLNVWHGLWQLPFLTLPLNKFSKNWCIWSDSSLWHQCSLSSVMYGGEQFPISRVWCRYSDSRHWNTISISNFAGKLWKSYIIPILLPCERNFLHHSFYISVWDHFQD